MIRNDAVTVVLVIRGENLDHTHCLATFDLVGDLSPQFVTIRR